MSIPTTLWPKPWLLQVYKEAIESGAASVGPMGGEENYKSFAAAFYRLRRRVDSQHDQFIEPSYHLCSLTWDPDNDRAIVTYDKLPDGMSMPTIAALKASDMPASTAVRASHQLPAASESPEDPAENFDSRQHISDLLAEVGKRIEGGDAKGDIE